MRLCRAVRKTQRLYTWVSSLDICVTAEKVVLVSYRHAELPVHIVPTVPSLGAQNVYAKGDRASFYYWTL